MAAIELVVAVAGEDKPWRVLHPPGEQPEHIERRLVRPVEILEHEHASPWAAQLQQERRRHLMRLRSACHQFLELSADALCDLEQRPERARGEQRVTGAPQGARGLPSTA